jgi:hypothetical protein
LGRYLLNDRPNIVCHAIPRPGNGTGQSAQQTSTGRVAGERLGPAAQTLLHEERENSLF